MLDKAIKLASNLKQKRYRLCAIITDKRNKILSIGFNHYNKTHPTQAYYAEKVGKKNAIYLHAEMEALIGCKHEPYAIYIARVNQKGKPRLAKPCKICKMAIQESGIQKIYYTKNKEINHE